MLVKKETVISRKELEIWKCMNVTGRANARIAVEFHFGWKRNLIPGFEKSLI